MRKTKIMPQAGEAEIRIEYNIPLPTTKRRYPFDKMNIGDSFAVSAKDRHHVRYAASGFRIRHKPAYRFSILRYNDSYRCWHVG